MTKSPLHNASVPGDHLLVVEKHVLDAGAAAYLTKPVQTENLYRAIQAAIESTPREHIRIDTCMPITIDGVQLDYEQGECVSELSEQGLHVRTRMPLQQKTLHSVSIRLHERAISLIAKTLYQHESGAEPGMGLEFVQISPQDQQYIKQYVHEEVTKGILNGGRKDLLEAGLRRRGIQGIIA